MTTKHITEQALHDPDTVVDHAARSTQQAEDASRELLAKARYDAFRLMTEARDEAETILDEARAEAAGTKNAAEITAKSVTEKAAGDSAQILESAREEAAGIVASAHREAGEQHSVEDKDELEKEHKALSDRVSTLRTLADHLEDRFAALAESGGKQVTPPEDQVDDTEGNESPPSIDYTPSVPPPQRDKEESKSEEADERGSFYNRRSANLPRLGEEGGRGAFDMTRSMRQSMETD
jgi:vacuolar-type H+-ATPase subunit H